MDVVGVVRLSRRRPNLPGTKVVDRRTPWGNKYKICETYPDFGYISHWDIAVKAFTAWFLHPDQADHRAKFLAECREDWPKYLGCWCAPDVCHADTLARFLNRNRDKQPGQDALIT